MSDDFGGDESPISDPAFVCQSDDPDCWCLVNYGTMRLCYCKQHGHWGTPGRRTKWNGKAY